MIFISYNHEDSGFVGRLEELLKSRGLRVWRDKSNLSHGNGLAEGIKEGLKKCTGMITIWSPRSFDSDGVKEEYAYGLKLIRDIKGFFQIPVFLDCTYKSAIEVMKNYNFKLGLERAEGQDLESFLKQIANSTLKRFCENVDTESEISVEIYSKRKPFMFSTSTFSFDYTDMLIGEKEKEPSTWQDIQQGIKDFYEKTSMTILARKIRFEAYCHYSLMVIFGNIFSEPSGYHLLIKQGDEQWSLKNVEPSDVVLRPQDEEGKGIYEKENAIIGISLEHDIWSNIPKNISYKIGKIYYPENQSTEKIKKLSNSEALGIAQKLRTELINIAKEHDVKKFHLFMSIPLGLALMIGYYSNGLKPIQLYEFDQTEQKYIPTIVV